MPPTPSRASSLYLSSRTTPTSGSGGALSATVESALKGVPSSGQTVTSESNCRPHCGHWSINFAAESERSVRSEFYRKAREESAEERKVFLCASGGFFARFAFKTSRTLLLGVRVHFFLNFRLLFSLDAGHGRAFGRLAVNLRVRAFDFGRLVLARQSPLPQILRHNFKASSRSYVSVVPGQNLRALVGGGLALARRLDRVLVAHAVTVRRLDERRKQRVRRERLRLVFGVELTTKEPR